ncbi:gibberellin-regulated protein 1 [Gossypium raimondii]|uniref:Uncharacterized protein n=1 Tax=Gossypium raimondii TaxID=29730 RepID=A0A0D2QJ84_GOSRA|nr:gibberellin-regulated protein 1 [Gossypium raimondii]KJB58102.1 hypothetical protein B456_009G194800 [Gossypium raimondii]UQE86461.1 GASA protein [Gossypium raimondii]
MAIFKSLLTSLLLSLFLLRFAESSDPLVIENMVEENSFNDKKIDCGRACAERCKLSSRPNLCKRACGTCCSRCNCVPPGTYNNYDVCPCYRDMTTHGGRHKCP